MKDTLKLLFLLFIFRFLNALLVTTFLFPDEWWQYSEPAHHVAYNYGYLTWDWRAGIRSYIMILPMICLHKMTQIFGFGESWVVRNGSKLIMASLMALTDLYTFKLAGKIFGPSSKSYALILSVTSAFHASRSIRCLSNNIEMALSAIALYYLPSKLSKGHIRLALIIIGITCLIRITAVMFWITPLILCLNWISWRDRLLTTPIIIMGTILFGILVDSYFYGKLTITWWNFFKWNILKNVSQYYGKESWLYHFKVTMPLMLNTHIGYFLFGFWRGWKRTVLAVMVVFILLNTLQSHKETRFLAPIYPIIILFCAHGLQQLTVTVSKKNKIIQLLLSLTLFGVICSQILIGWFYARVHFNGSYEIVDKLRTLIDKNANENNSVFFLTPCHVIPFQGYLHREKVKADFLKCHPKAVDEVMPIIESNSRDLFQNDPIGFVNNHVIIEKYRFIVLFEGDSHKYLESFVKAGYKECGRADNSSILTIGSNKLRGDLIIYCNPEL